MYIGIIRMYVCIYIYIYTHIHIHLSGPPKASVAFPVAAAKPQRPPRRLQAYTIYYRL